MTVKIVEEGSQGMVVHRGTYVASTAILLAREKGEFRLPELRDRLDLPDEGMPSNSMTREVLRQLEESGWLERKHPEGRIWYAGENITSNSS